MTPSGGGEGDTRLKVYFVAGFRKNIGQTMLELEDGSGEETTAKKGHHFPEAMTKQVVSFFSRKNRVTPSVAAPGDTNPSDATANTLANSFIRHACGAFSVVSIRKTVILPPYRKGNRSRLRLFCT